MAETTSLTLKNSFVANALRRVILNDIASYAPSHITLRRNTSLMTDDMLAFNIAWLKLACVAPDVPAAIDRALSLTVTNTERSTKNVTGADFVVHADTRFKVAEPDAVVCKLAPGEELDIDVAVRRGTGKQHSKYSAATKVGVLCTGDGCAEMCIEAAAGNDAAELLRQAVSELRSQLQVTIDDLQTV